MNCFLNFFSILSLALNIVFFTSSQSFLESAVQPGKIAQASKISQVNPLNFSHFTDLAKEWCLETTRSRAVPRLVSDNFVSRCKSLGRLKELAEEEGPGRPWNFQHEYWKQVQSLQYFLVSEGLGPEYQEMDVKLLKRANQLRSVLAGLKSYLLFEMQENFKEQVDVAAEMLRDKAKHALVKKEDCSAQKGYRCVMDYGQNYFGFGALVAFLNLCLVEAIKENTMLAFDPEEFAMKNHTFDPPEQCDNFQGLKQIPVFSKTYMELVIPKDSVWGENKLAAPYFPHPETELAWFMGVLQDHLVQPRPEIIQRASKRLADWQLLGQEPFAGIHIRMGAEKIPDSLPNPIEKYLIEVEEWFAIEEIRLGKQLRRLVFIATDTASVIDQVKAVSPEFEIFYDFGVINSRKPNNPSHINTHKDVNMIPDLYNYKSEDNVQNMALDIETLVRADFFVGTATSYYGRLVHMLRSARNPYKTFFDSAFIDWEFYYGLNKVDRTYIVQEMQWGDDYSQSRLMKVRRGDEIQFRAPFRDQAAGRIKLKAGLIYGRSLASNETGYFYRHKVLLKDWLM